PHLPVARPPNQNSRASPSFSRAPPALILGSLFRSHDFPIPFLILLVRI
ncbi:uncharacterized protein J3R85_011046, partial [Psidium guajava]